MSNVIPGKDALPYDKSDWDIKTIPVHLNPEGLPSTISVAQVEAMIKQACFSWSLRYAGHTLQFMGHFNGVHKPGSVVLTYTTSEVIHARFGERSAGLCMYHYRDWNGQKWIMDSCEVYIDKAARPIADDYALALIMHEFGHVCGIAGHTDEPGCVMSKGRHKNTRLTLTDCHMLDRFDPYPIELHADMSMSCPAVDMPDGHVKWVDLKYSGNRLLHTWELSAETPWQGPRIDNVRMGYIKEFHGKPCQYIHMKDVRSQDLHVRADLLLAPNGTIILEYAE